MKPPASLQPPTATGDAARATEEEEEFTFPSSDGVTLSGILNHPSGGDDPQHAGMAFVLCHPHPYLGGSMTNPLMTNLARRLAASGIAVLRFNFRGVGASTGKRTWMRQGECSDVLAGVHYLTQRHGVDPRRVYVAGYSFGAAIALSALDKSDLIRGFVGISYPWGVKSMLVPAQPTCKSTKPKLFLTATEDVVCRNGADEATAEVMALPQPRTLVVVDADHSWERQHRPLSRHVLDWLSQQNDPSMRISRARPAVEMEDGGEDPTTPRRMVPQGVRARVGPTTPRHNAGNSGPTWDQQLRRNSGFIKGPSTPRHHMAGTPRQKVGFAGKQNGWRTAGSQDEGDQESEDDNYGSEHAFSMRGRSDSYEARGGHGDPWSLEGEAPLFRSKSESVIKMRDSVGVGASGNSFSAGRPPRGGSPDILPQRSGSPNLRRVSTYESVPNLHHQIKSNTSDLLPRASISKKSILKRESSVGNLAMMNKASQKTTPDVDEAGGPMLLKLFGGKENGGKNNVFRRAAKAVMAANRFKAAGKKRVMWDETTACGALITEQKSKKPSKPKRHFRSAARAIIAANRFGSFAHHGDAGGGNTARNPSPDRGTFNGVGEVRSESPPKNRRNAGSRFRAAAQAVVASNRWAGLGKSRADRYRAPTAEDPSSSSNGSGYSAGGGRGVQFAGADEESARGPASRSSGAGGRLPGENGYGQRGDGGGTGVDAGGRPALRKNRFRAAARAVVAGVRMTHDGRGG